MAQAEWKAEVEPCGEADDLGWEAVAGVTGRGGRGYLIRLRNPADFGNTISLRPQPLNLTVPSRLRRAVRNFLHPACLRPAPWPSRPLRFHSDDQHPAGRIAEISPTTTRCRSCFLARVLRNGLTLSRGIPCPFRL